ncbi:MAG: sugar porter family MFS transporter [Niabella sp.]
MENKHSLSQTNEGSKRYVLKIALVAALGGLLFGYDTAVISGVIGSLQKKFDLSPLMMGWAASSAIWGCIAGVLVAGFVSDKIGRKKTLAITAVLFLISSVVAAIPQNLTGFIIGRFIGGLGIGAASIISPLYISEVAPAKSRGTLVTMYQLAIVIGINLIYFVNLKIADFGDEQWNTDTGWRYMIASGALPSVLFLVLLFTVPESPRWLVSKKRTDDGFKILEKINGTEEASSILNEIENTLGSEKGKLNELLQPGIRIALIIGIVLALFSQITGINAIIYYAPEIFKSVGFRTDSALLQTVLIGVVNTIFTFVAIGFIDKIGRKKLLLIGVAGMIVCLLGIGICYYADLMNGPLLLIFILAYIACFASSLGAVPWVILSEIFPTKIRGAAMSVATVVLWIGVLLITQLTPWLLENLGGAYTFWLFMLNSIILFIFTWARIPETKQKTLEEIERGWHHK